MHTTNPSRKPGAGRKDVLTTGDVARICNVAPRTVSKWFDSGQLRGYRIPGSKDRRIPVQQLIRFMKLHNIPLNGLDAGTTRVLVIDADRDFAATLADALARGGEYDVRTATSAFDAGLATQAHKPDVLLVDSTLPNLTGREFVRTLRSNPEFDGVRIIAMAPSNDAALHATLRDDGFDAVLAKPFDAAKAIAAIEASLSPS
ncbi:MAG: hypothetical protein HBSAPP02_24170 [Phycisphaerae bacterium]|nr:MAG: response regulator [Planctomycetia bacterium]GJQ27385.1 MAG: hypothetical protein HBSAPP02_24170 [Phycisphaerae bacterium]